MGWARTLLLGDVGNRLDIEDTERDIQRLANDVRAQESTDRSQDVAIRALTRENGELKLALTAVVRLCMAKEVFTREELDRLIEVIDLEDGKADGQMR